MKILLGYAVGDLHGDLDQARCAFEMAGVLSSDGRDVWTGGETVFILVNLVRKFDYLIS